MIILIIILFGTLVVSHVWLQKKKCERKLKFLGEGILARGMDGSVMNYGGFWRSFRLFDWEDGKIGE